MYIWPELISSDHSEGQVIADLFLPVDLTVSKANAAEWSLGLRTVVIAVPWLLAATFSG